MTSRASEILRFLAVGGAAAGLAFLLRRLMVDFGMPFNAAVPTAYIACIPVGYVLNKRYVFDSNGSARAGEFAQFCLALLVGLCTAWGVSAAVRALGAIDDIAHLGGIGASAIVGYLLTRLVFAKADAKLA